MNKNRQLSRKRRVTDQKAGVFFLICSCTLDSIKNQKKLVCKFRVENAQTAIVILIFLNKNRQNGVVGGWILVWPLPSRYFSKILTLNLSKLLTDWKKLAGARRTSSPNTVSELVRICLKFPKRLFQTIFNSTANPQKRKRDQCFDLLWKKVVSDAMKSRYNRHSIVDLCSNISYYWGFVDDR